jgi:hypothetical protein
MHLLIRIFVIAFGFVSGCVAAGLAYVFLAKLVVPEDFGALDELELTVTLVVGVFGVSSLFARAVFVPALAAIAAFEMFKLRDWLSYALSGGVLALAVAGWPLVSGEAVSDAPETGSTDRHSRGLRDHRRNRLLEACGPQCRPLAAQ